MVLLWYLTEAYLPAAKACLSVLNCSLGQKKHLLFSSQVLTEVM